MPAVRTVYSEVIVAYIQPFAEGSTVIYTAPEGFVTVIKWWRLTYEGGSFGAHVRWVLDSISHGDAIITMGYAEGASVGPPVNLDADERGEVTIVLGAGDTIRVELQGPGSLDETINFLACGFKLTLP